MIDVVHVQKQGGRGAYLVGDADVHHLQPTAIDVAVAWRSQAIADRILAGIVHVERRAEFPVVVDEADVVSPRDKSWYLAVLQINRAGEPAGCLQIGVIAARRQAFEDAGEETEGLTIIELKTR